MTNDVLIARLGDGFFGGGGDYYGGSGQDAVKFGGNVDDYLFSRSEDGPNIVVVGPEWRHTLDSIEFLIFDDVIFPITDGFNFYVLESLIESYMSPSVPGSIQLVGDRTVHLINEIFDTGDWTYTKIDTSARILDENGVAVGEDIYIYI